MAIQFFENTTEMYSHTSDIVKDLNVDVIVKAMAHKDYGDVPFIKEIMMHPLFTETAVKERQSMVKAACEKRELTYEFRKVIMETSETLDKGIKAIQDSRGKHLTEETIIGTRVDALRTLVNGLVALDSLMDKHADVFQKTAWNRFYREFYENMPKERLKEQRYLVDNMDSFKTKGEILLRGRIAEGMHLKDVQILDVKEKAEKVSGGIFSARRNDVIADEEIYQSGVEFTNGILREVLEYCFPYMKQWQDYLLVLKKQIAFLAGCAKLYERAKEIGLELCYPQEDAETEELYELSLALQTHIVPVSNSIDVAPYQIIVVTGANQGGKSTYLRSLGIAQIMMQAGMYVPATSYPLQVFSDIFPHFTRREDASMNMGKFEEELKRMDDMLRKAKKGCLFLLNESFATTTEVTAYQIAMDLVHACMEKGVTMWTVTHITKFAKELYRENRDAILFLSAGRVAEKERQYTMVEKAPGDTSYGLELYEKIIETKKSVLL